MKSINPTAAGNVDDLMPDLMPDSIPDSMSEVIGTSIIYMQYGDAPADSELRPMEGITISRRQHRPRQRG